MRPEVEENDKFGIELIKHIFNDKKGKAGARTIKMALLRDFAVIMNLKKIVRIKKKYGLKTLIRRRSKYNWVGSMGKNHHTLPNYLDRNFVILEKDQVYSTDITSLSYGKNQRAYLSAVKDLGTKEILHYTISRSMTLNIAMNGIEELYEKLPLKVRRKLIVHSDQGCHYTSHDYRNLLEELKILQSMSRRGNCLDNAPIESFFGHMKDELELKSCHRYEELVNNIEKYINYYNNERPQWGLQGKTPAECRSLF